MEKLNIRAAVCAVLSYKDKIFYVKRQNYLRNFPGYHSFPGGKVNREEIDLDLECINYKELEPLLLGALEREVLEELGISLKKLQETSKIDSIIYCAKAITPEFNPYRFATHYFLISLNELPPFKLDETEFERGEWLHPQEFCEEFEKGKVLTVKPILEFSKELYKGTPKEWISFTEWSYDLCPMIEPIKGLMQFMPLSNTLPPATRTNAFLIGDDGSPKIIVDPSPKDKEELEKFIKAIEPYKVTHIFITHHHGDHHEFAPELARRFNLPLYMSKLTYEYINLKRGETYLQETDIQFVSHGDVLTKTRGHDVLVYEVPGHDLGQLALYPKDLSWFIAGDLFQGIGSVVVGGEQASMTKYFETLNNVITLAPFCVVPSHGIALGGTDILQKNLEHRKFRESQVEKLLKKNLSSLEMTQILYQGLPQSLVKYAEANVISHIKKINNED